MSLAIDFLKFILAIILIIGGLIIGMYLIPMLLDPNHEVYGQNATPPAVVTPTTTLAPTPTSPNPNLQYLPQKSYVQTFAPEVGIPSSVPLQPVPQVIPVQQPVQSNGFLGGNGDIMGIIATLGAAGAYLKGHLANKKADKAEDTSQSNAAMNVKQSSALEQALQQMFANMADGGQSINDKPDIRLTEIAKMKDQAVETATKA